MKLSVALFLLLPGIAMAEQAAPMLDLTVVLRRADGVAEKNLFDRKEDDKDCAKCRDLTVAEAIAITLDNQYPGETNVPFKDFLARGLLAKRIRETPSLSLSAAEVNTIETLLAKAGWRPHILVQIAGIIDAPVVHEAR